MEKRREITKLYKRATGYCANPEYGKTYGLHVHHIEPLHNGGKDTYINYIVLCGHRDNGFHRIGYDKLQVLQWKFYQEYLAIGRTSDEHTEREYRALLLATVKAREST